MSTPEPIPHDWQAGFADALCQPDAAPPNALTESGSAATRSRYNVYRNNVTVSLIDALADTYPAVQSLVGEAFFRAAARVFVDRQKPLGPRLFEYGAEFAGFLRDFPPAQTVPYLPDVARVEWAYLRAYHAADAEPIALDSLGAVAPDALDTLALRLLPSAQLVTSSYPAVTLWAESTGRGSGRRPDLTHGETALVLRPDADVDVRVLDPTALPFVAALLEGRPLGAAAARATAKAEEAGATFDLAVHLSGLFETGAIAELVVQATPPPPHNPE